MTLPIDQTLPELIKALGSNNNVVLQAPPGAGKTTRVPLALLNEAWLGKQKIIMLEPRRLAARNAAHYMAAGLNEKIGQTVGYRVRMDSRVSDKTRIEVVTEGILTRMLQSDPTLENIGLVIFDEFHERSLQADLGLALCLESQAVLRENLRLLVMSATLDGAAVAKLMGNAPIVISEGRSFAVEVRYAAPPRHTTKQQLLQHISNIITKIIHKETGSVLVFLPGVAEIRRVEQLLESSQLGEDTLITPLYGELNIETQELAIQPPPSSKRKIVLSTNIAETSLTIDGIRLVIDSGLVRTPRFNPSTALTRLETINISQASAEQRRGRAGRLEPGICYRLWPEGQHLLTHTAPEIMEADLAPLALELSQWGCGNPQQLQWLNPPPEANYNQAQDLLKQLDALSSDGRITKHGKTMASLPLHPRLAHMVLKGKDIGAGQLSCNIAALLSERDLLRKDEHYDSDLRTRLTLLAKNDQQANRSYLKRIRHSSKQWQQQLKIKDEQTDLSLAGVLLGHAYPDRIAQHRPGKEPRYLLANGRGAKFVEHETLGNEPYLVIAELTTGEKEARIFLAASIDASQIEKHFIDLIEIQTSIEWYSDEKAVLARHQHTLGALILHDKPLTNPDPELMCNALIKGIRQTGLQYLPWSKATRNWQLRTQFMHRLDGEQWPDVSKAALLQTLEIWLLPFLTHMNRLNHLQKLDLQAALNTHLTWNQQQMLDQLAPTHIEAPSGSRIAINYDNDPPILPVRLQEMFGTGDTPTIANGRVKLLLHLLSPAHRPLQITQDLNGFWQSSYAEVKKEMKGCYPKHHWPDNPLQAEPTRRAKRHRS